MSTDERQAASQKIAELIGLLKTHQTPESPAIIEEAEALTRAIAAFHMEAIRFRMYNVGRMVDKHGASLPSGASALLEEARRHLEAAGFHTRSHQAPTTTTT